MNISVVVPTFNRGPRLGETLRRLLMSNLDPDDDFQIIVVDDGSRVPARGALAEADLGPHPTRHDLRWIRQENAGPAAARNLGFRAARGEIVLFVDDDILVPPDLVRAHLAAHRANPGSVLFGLCPYSREPEGPFRNYVLASSEDWLTAPEFLEVPIVASGHMSVERSQFPEAGVYLSALSTPAAEEYELSLRLRQRRIPILLATRIVAIHDQPVEPESSCRQQYKHGVGCGEAAVKCPATLALPELARIIEANRPGRLSARQLAKTIFSSGPARKTLVALARILERAPAPERLRAAVFRGAVSAHFVAGVRSGLTRFESGSDLAVNEVGSSC